MVLKKFYFEIILRSAVVLDVYFYLGGCVHAMENPKLEPDGFDNRLVIVNGVLPVLPSLEDSGGSNSKYCRNLFSSLPETRIKDLCYSSITQIIGARVLDVEKQKYTVHENVKSLKTERGVFSRFFSVNKWTFKR